MWKFNSYEPGSSSPEQITLPQAPTSRSLFKPLSRHRRSVYIVKDDNSECGLYCLTSCHIWASCLSWFGIKDMPNMDHRLGLAPSSVRWNQNIKCHYWFRGTRISCGYQIPHGCVEPEYHADIKYHMVRWDQNIKTPLSLGIAMPSPIQFGGASHNTTTHGHCRSHRLRNA